MLAVATLDNTCRAYRSTVDPYRMGWRPAGRRDGDDLLPNRLRGIARPVNLALRLMAQPIEDMELIVARLARLAPLKAAGDSAAAG